VRYPSEVPTGSFISGLWWSPSRALEAPSPGDVEVSTYVVASEVVDGGLGEHAVVLELRLAERRSVASNDDELGLARSQALQCGLVAKGDLAGL
jgi:hypothetical protein